MQAPSQRNDRRGDGQRSADTSTAGTGRGAGGSDGDGDGDGETWVLGLDSGGILLLRLCDWPPPQHACVRANTAHMHPVGESSAATSVGFWRAWG